MIYYQHYLQYLSTRPLLLTDGGSNLAKNFISDVQRKYSTVVIDLGKTTVDSVLAQVLALDKDVLPILLVPCKITNNDTGVFIRDLLKGDQLYYKGKEVSVGRFLLVMECETLGDFCVDYRPKGMPVIPVYRIENREKFEVGDITLVYNRDTHAITAYKDGCFDEYDVKAATHEAARRIGMDIDPEWTVATFRRKLIRQLQNNPLFYLLSSFTHNDSSHPRGVLYTPGAQDFIDVIKPVPNLPGIYRFYDNSTGELIYVGMSAKWGKNNQPSDFGVHKRLNASRAKDDEGRDLRSDEYYTQVCNDMLGGNSIRIEWDVTDEKPSADLKLRIRRIESLLIHEYANANSGRLPILNNDF